MLCCSDYGLMNLVIRIVWLVVFVGSCCSLIVFDLCNIFVGMFMEEIC